MIKIDGRSPVPPYEQLRLEFARQITERVLPAGTRLPTVRRLAADLGLAANTVGRAYRELEEAGLIETNGRAGTFVAAQGGRTQERAQQAAEAYATEAARLGLEPDHAIAIVTAAIRAARRRPQLSG
jgi:DNA-binding transcriptional regulator YhcF (GntR family)